MAQSKVRAERANLLKVVYTWLLVEDSANMLSAAWAPTPGVDNATAWVQGFLQWQPSPAGQRAFTRALPWLVSMPAVYAAADNNAAERAVTGRAHGARPLYYAAEKGSVRLDVTRADAAADKDTEATSGMEAVRPFTSWETFLEGRTQAIAFWNKATGKTASGQEPWHRRSACTELRRIADGMRRSAQLADARGADAAPEAPDAPKLPEWLEKAGYRRW